MPAILVNIFLMISTTVGSFVAGMQIDLSRHIEWILYDAAYFSTLVIHQNLEGSIDDYYKRNVFLHKTATEAVMKMSPEKLAGQVLMPSWDNGTSIDEMIARVEKYHLGGVIVLRNDTSPGEVQTLMRALENVTPNISPFLAIDAEPSLLKYRLPQEGYNTSTVSLTNEELASKAGNTIGAMIQRYGYNLNFAPVYDSGENLSIIGERAFGRNFEEITPQALAFAQALHSQNIISTAKHFPGHGYVQGDTHLTLESVPGNLPEIDVFRFAVQNKTPMIMVGHLAVAEGEYDTAGMPSTLSSRIMKDLLREEMGYTGVVITDGMFMGALNGFSNVDEKSLEAGADIVLQPRELDDTYTLLVARIESDKEFHAAMREKVYRIIRLKLVHQWAAK